MAHDSFKDDILNGIYNNFPAVVGTLAVGSLLVWSYFSFNDDANSKALTSTQNKVAAPASITHSGSGTQINIYDGGVNNIYICCPEDTAKMGSIDAVVTSVPVKKPIKKPAKKSSTKRTSRSKSPKSVVERTDNTLRTDYKPPEPNSNNSGSDISSGYTEPVLDDFPQQSVDTTYTIDSAKLEIILAAGNRSLDRFGLEKIENAYKQDTCCPK